MASNSSLSFGSSSNSSDTASVLGAPRAPSRVGLRYTNYLGQTIVLPTPTRPDFKLIYFCIVRGLTGEERVLVGISEPGTLYP
ncbi:hypothetical protein HHUSO_G2984 [Huso huso]|uniref:Uncharacterized protein n=1 Tax=Huso huso TaxID=61971 RepID=A0ABR1A8H9_HUSHU